MFNKPWGSARIMRQEARKATFQQYIGKYQKNISNRSIGRMYSEIGRVSEINKYVAKYKSTRKYEQIVQVMCTNLNFDGRSSMFNTI